MKQKLLKIYVYLSYPTFFFFWIKNSNNRLTKYFLKAMKYKQIFAERMNFIQHDSYSDLEWDSNAPPYSENQFSIMPSYQQNMWEN